MGLLISAPAIPLAIPPAMGAAPAAATQWLLPANLFRLLVVGSIVGLVVATLVIVLIWLKEWRQGQVW
jgi:hypothetical protein